MTGIYQNLVSHQNIAEISAKIAKRVTAKSAKINPNEVFEKKRKINISLQHFIACWIKIENYFNWIEIKEV